MAGVGHACIWCSSGWGGRPSQTCARLPHTTHHGHRSPHACTAVTPSFPSGDSAREPRRWVWLRCPLRRGGWLQGRRRRPHRRLRWHQGRRRVRKMRAWTWPRRTRSTRRSRACRAIGSCTTPIAARCRRVRGRGVAILARARSGCSAACTKSGRLLSSARCRRTSNK